MMPVLIAIAPLCFVATWLLATAIVARIGGWRELAERYEAQDGAEPERRYRFQSVVLRRVSLFPARYRGSVHIGLGAAGIQLAPVFVFRFQHPPLLIPWPAITRCEAGALLGFGWHDVEVRDATPTLRFYGKVGEEIAAEWSRWGAGRDGSR